MKMNLEEENQYQDVVENVQRLNSWVGIDPRTMVDEG